MSYKTNSPSSPPPLPLNILLGPLLRKCIRLCHPRLLASSYLCFCQLIHVSIDLIIPGGSSSRKLAINKSQYNLICFDSPYTTAEAISFLSVKSVLIMSIIRFNRLNCTLCIYFGHPIPCICRIDFFVKLRFRQQTIHIFFLACV